MTYRLVMNVTWHPLSDRHIHLPVIGMDWLKPSCNLLMTIAGIWICFYGAIEGKYLLTSTAAFLLLIAHVSTSKNRMIEASVIICTGIIGAAIESINLTIGVYQYISSTEQFALLPTWIVMMWFFVGTTTRQLFANLSNRFATTSVTGALIGTLIYYVAAKMGAIEFSSNNTPFSVIPILLWSLAFPLIIFIGNQFFTINEPPSS